MRNNFFRVTAIQLHIPMGVSMLLGAITLPAVAVDLDLRRVGSYNTSGSARGVAVSGNFACVADLGAGLQVIDVSNPANPQRVGGYDTGGIAWRVTVSGNYAFVADGGGGLQIIDVSNPASPQRVGGYHTSGQRGVAVSGNYAYVANNTAGLHVIDVSNPANPQRVGGNPAPVPALAVAVSERSRVCRGRGQRFVYPESLCTGPCALPGLAGPGRKLASRLSPGSAWIAVRSPTQRRPAQLAELDQRSAGN